jgi:hypothetical protein
VLKSQCDRPVFILRRLLPHRTISEEKGPEGFEDALDFSANVAKARNERLTFKNIAESYFKAKVRILVVLRSVSGKPSTQFVAVFERALESEAALSRLSAIEQFHLEHSLLDDGQRVGSRDRHEQAMLVHNVEFVEPTKSIVPSMVWLLSLDEIERLLAGTLYCSLKVGFKDFQILPIEDRETGADIRRVTIGQNQLPSEMVKAGSQVMDSISENEGNFLGRTLEGSKLYDSVARLRIVVGNSAVWVALPESVQFGFEIADVLFGPFDLCVD